MLMNFFIESCIWSFSISVNSPVDLLLSIDREVILIGSASCLSFSVFSKMSNLKE